MDKKKQYFRAYSDGKNVLRRALDTLVPQEVLKRRKQDSARRTSLVPGAAPALRGQ